MLASVATSIDFCFPFVEIFILFLRLCSSLCVCVCVVVKVSMLQFVLNLENCVLFLFSGVLAAHQQSLHFTVVTREKGARGVHECA